MAKYFGKIGYAESVETAPGVWEEKIVERSYYGDLLSNSRNLESSGDLNDDINVSNKISIVSDPYAQLNFHAMRYIEWMGAKWKVSTVDASTLPRLILTTRGLYNG